MEAFVAILNALDISADQVLQDDLSTPYQIRTTELQKLKHGTGGLDARTIEKLCRLLECQPGDIMEYTEDKED